MAPGGFLKAEIERGGLRCRAPLRLGSDDWISLVQVWIEPDYYDLAAVAADLAPWGLRLVGQGRIFFALRT
jgi:hypothetical protein